MPYNLLLLPLLGGFLLIHRMEFTNFRAQRLDGYRLLFESALAGLLLTALARLIVVVSEPYTWLQWIGERWWHFAPFPYSDTAVLSLVLALLLPLAVNWIFPRNAARTWAIKRSGDGLTRLLDDAEQRSRLVSLTMGNMKWYVGFSQRQPNLVPQDTYIRLRPIISGYRDRATLQTIRTVFYQEALAVKPEADLSVVLPISEIKSANLFDADLYQDVFAADSSQPGRST